MYMTDAQQHALPVNRRWIPGHKRLVAPRGAKRGKRGVAEGYDVLCKCGWKADHPVRTASESYEVYGQHFRQVAGTIEVQSIPTRRAFKIRGHSSIVSPNGEVHPRRPVLGGWSTSCTCGWRAASPSRTKTDARNAYGEHLDAVVGDDWPICKRCEEITRPSRMSKGSPHLCKKCRTAATREWAEANPGEWERHRRKSYLKRTYGITPEQADDLLAAQEGRCAICGASEGDSRGFRMHIDHCHTTGVVRGVLCNLCNAGLGNFRDDAELMQKAIAYLARHQGEKTA